MSAKVKRCLRKSYRIVSGEEEKRKENENPAIAAWMQTDCCWLKMVFGGQKNEEQEMDEQIPLVIVDQ